MINDEQLQRLLGLSDIEIERVVMEDDQRLIIYVNSLKDGAACHCCGQWTTDYFGRGQEITLRHLSMGDYQTSIVITPKRYRCSRCDSHPTTTQSLEWYTPRSAFTKSFEQHILRELINSTLEDASAKCAVTPDQIHGVMDRYLAHSVDWNAFKILEILGIDEISLKKGHQDFVVVVSAIVDGKLTILSILSDRTKDTVEKFFRSIPKRLRKTVRLVCSDLYAGFIGAAKAVFGRQAAICADRFHVARLYRDGLESLRKKEMRRLKKELSSQEYQSLKNVHWILRKSDSELTSDERRTRTRLFRLSPKVQQAYELINALTEIYERPLSKGQGKRKIRGWITRVKNSDLTCFNSFLKTLDRHWEEITNYFIRRQTSGFVEGLNNKIKVLKRRGYGLTNLKRLYQRVYLDLHGYTLFA